MPRFDTFERKADLARYIYIFSVELNYCILPLNMDTIIKRLLVGYRAK